MASKGPEGGLTLSYYSRANRNVPARESFHLMAIGAQVPVPQCNEVLTYLSNPIKCSLTRGREGCVNSARSLFCALSVKRIP